MQYPIRCLMLLFSSFAGWLKGFILLGCLRQYLMSDVLCFCFQALQAWPEGVNLIGWFKPFLILKEIRKASMTSINIIIYKTHCSTSVIIHFCLHAVLFSKPSWLFLYCPLQLSALRRDLLLEKTTVVKILSWPAVQGRKNIRKKTRIAIRKNKWLLKQQQKRGGNPEKGFCCGFFFVFLRLS